MSFQAIRKIRDAKRQSPVIFGSEELEPYTNPTLHLPINLKLKSNDVKEKKSTRDSQKKTDLLQRHTRKNSFGISNSKQKERRTMFGNFLHINLDGLNKISASKQLKYRFQEGPKTQRLSIIKSNTEDYERQEYNQKVSLSSFNMDFCVGKGGFGKVWKVSQKNTGKIFAMKQMQKVKIISKRSVHSVINQKKLLQKLNHPFIVNMVYAFQTREQLFLVMDYCNRGDMRYHIGNRRRFKEDESRFFIACIILSLEYLHKNKVMHRDLKPQNLVLDDKGYVRVTDLGVSREMKPNNAEDTSGTPGYMAPQVICKMDHSYPVDFFALGVIAYQFMIGKRPYVGQNRKEIREKILAKQVQLDEIPPFGWSRQSVDFVNRLIQRKPQSRLGYNGIEQVKGHPWFKKMDWEKLADKKIPAPFLPVSIEEDYNNYKECISEDTQIENMQEYKLVLRHRDTQEAFTGYDFNVSSPRIRRKISIKRQRLD